MGREWKPGDVARIELGNGVTHSVAVRLPLHEGGWATGRSKYVHSVHVVDARPLVVIDPREIVHPSRLIEILRREGWVTLARLIEEGTAPPKPDEPTGLGAVVEDADGKRWSRAGGAFSTSANWLGLGSVRYTRYADIAAVKVLSDGVQP